jgi:hypothetical protein
VALPGNANPFTRRNEPPFLTDALSFRETIVALFLFPHVVLLNTRQRPQLGQAILLVGLVLVGCGIALGLGNTPQALLQVEEAASWLGNQMGELRRTEDGSLAWNRAEDAPTTLDYQGLRIDFAPKDSEFDLKKVSGDNPGGLWIGPREIRFWPVLGGTSSWPVFLADSRWKALNWNDHFPAGSVIQGERFAPLALAWLRWGTPFFLIFLYVFAITNIYLILLAIFTILPLVLRRPRLPGEAQVAFCVNLYCSVIPLVVATAYHLAAPKTLDFSTLFVFAFLGYLIWAFSRVRGFLAGDAPRAG